MKTGKSVPGCCWFVHVENLQLLPIVCLWNRLGEGDGLQGSNLCADGERHGSGDWVAACHHVPQRPGWWVDQVSVAWLFCFGPWSGPHNDVCRFMLSWKLFANVCGGGGGGGNDLLFPRPWKSVIKDCMHFFWGGGVFCYFQRADVPPCHVLYSSVTSYLQRAICSLPCFIQQCYVLFAESHMLLAMF